MIIDIFLDPQLHRFLIGFLFLLAGILHFLKPKFFMKIMPNYLPCHRSLVLISGIFEIAGGIALIIPFLQLYAAWGLILLLISVFPANIEMFRKVYRKRGFTFYTWMLLLRLPLQFVIIYWVYWAGV